MSFPEPFVSQAVKPRTQADQEKSAMSRLAQEDLSFCARTDPESSQTFIEDMGELHLEIDAAKSCGA